MTKEKFDQLTKDELQDLVLDLIDVVQTLQDKLDCVYEDLRDIDTDYDGYIIDDLLTDKYGLPE